MQEDFNFRNQNIQYLTDLDNSTVTLFDCYERLLIWAHLSFSFIKYIFLNLFPF